MGKREKLVQILYNDHATVQAETEPRQQSWGFQTPLQQLLVIEIFRQLQWMAELANAEEELQPLQHPWLSTALQQGLGQPTSSVGGRYGSQHGMSQSKTRSLGQTGK